MPGKKAKGATKKQRAAGGTIESADAKVLANAKGHGGSTKKATTATDEQIEKSLHANLLELAQHSHTCFEYASKHLQRTGKGCVFWLFPDYESSVAVGVGSEAVAPAVQYHSRERAMASEYAPVIEMIEKYDPNNAFVALVAIRTGDRRDSLMKVMIIGAQTQVQMHFEQPRRYAQLQFVGAGADRAAFAIGDDCEFCSNSLCWKVEPAPKAFAKCAGCGCKKYCGRDCQVLHWKLEHKAQCATDKANLERIVNAHVIALAAAKAKAAQQSAAAGAGDGAVAAAAADPEAAAALASAALRPIIRAGLDDGKVPGTDIPSKITKSIHVKDAGAAAAAAAAAAAGAAGAADAKQSQTPAPAAAAAVPATATAGGK